ncbi:MAG: S1C family serine protease [Verrucomicrobiales bacterium]
MKTSRILLRSAAMAFTAMASLAVLPLAFAEENAAAENQPAPTVAAEAPAGAWLGVLTKPLPKIIGEHLGLAPGEGLAVEMVVPDSPAAAAGLQVDDVLTKLDEQKLVLPDQLSILLDGAKPGQDSKLEVLRDGKPVQLAAKLGERPAQFAKRNRAAGEEGEPRNQVDINGLNGIDQLNDMQGMLRILPRDGQMDLAQIEKQLENMRADMQKRVEKMRIEAEVGGGNGQVQMQVFRLDQGRIQIGDNEGTITIERQDGKKTLKATDKQGNVLFEGPYDTDEEKAAVPDPIRKRAERFNIQDGGVRGFMEKCDEAPAQPQGGIEGDVKPGDRVD